VCELPNPPFAPAKQASANRQTKCNSMPAPLALSMLRASQIKWPVRAPSHFLALARGVHLIGG
jgi:hypothetical protein